MGNAGEVVAVDYGISRQAQDAYALESHRKAAEATAAGRFRAEILPVDHSPEERRSDRRSIATNRSVRDTTIEALGGLKPGVQRTAP